MSEIVRNSRKRCLESLGLKTMFLEDHPCKSKKKKLLSVRAENNTLLQELKTTTTTTTTIIITGSGKGCCRDSTTASIIARKIGCCPADSDDEKTLRIATLKARFAGTILKAEKTLLEARGGGCGDVASELQRLERQQQQLRENNGRSEEEAYKRRKGKAARLLLQLERQRQRETLENMERSSVALFEDNLKWLKDLEKCCYSSSSGRLYFDVRRGKPLEQLGLYLKEEESPFGEYDEEEEELEEGEIPQ